MLRSSALFQAVALPYELLTRHPVWQRHCARMALELPRGARLILDLGCGPGNSTVQLPAGAVGGDHAFSMLHRARRLEPRMPLLCLDAIALPVRSGSLDAVTFHSVLYLISDQAAVLREKQIEEWRRDWKLNLIERDNPQWRDLYEELT